jgi:hypothetical protein
MKNYWLWMVLGCGLPLLFIFFAPSLGIGGGTALFTFFIVMFAFHLLIPMKHSDYTHGLFDENLNRKNEKSEHKGQHH